MASTVSADKHADEYTEIMDTPSDVVTKVKDLAKLVQKYRGNVVFVTGAGISTSCGIPDFRSGLGSATGMPAGKWCVDATKNTWTAAELAEHRARAKATSDTLCAIPSPSHMALVALHEAGVIKGVISQNCDGLHRRSAFPPESLAELHGCGNLEYCGWCGQEYLRDFKAARGRYTHGRALKQQLWSEHSKNPDLINPRSGNHYTGRRCQVPGCDGYLFDSTIDFGDNLPEAQLEKAEALVQDAKLCIVLGSRCAVSPACEFPLSIGRRKGSHLVVVNLQRTHADECATMRIGAKIDDVMVPLMQELGLQIPRFTLRRQIRVIQQQIQDGPVVSVKDVRRRLYFGGIDPAGLPADTIWNVQATLAANPEWTPTHYNHRAKVVFNNDAVQPTGRASGTGRRSKVAPQREYPVKPGDCAEVALLPWENEAKPGRLAVNLRGKLRSASRAEVLQNGRRLNAVSPDITDVVDETVQCAGFQVQNAGSKHGPQLLHCLELPQPAEPMQIRSIALMFRGHYLEPPLPLDLDQLPTTNGEEVVFDVEFDPAKAQWHPPRLRIQTERIASDSNIEEHQGKRARSGDHAKADDGVKVGG